MTNHDIRQVTVISNCQTPSYVNALLFLFPYAEVVGFRMAEALDPERREAVLARVRMSDLVLSTASGPEYGELSHVNLPDNTARAAFIPTFAFAGFHPDIAYVETPDGMLQSPLGEINSALVVAGALAGLPAIRLRRLFNTMIYSEFGYLDAYESSVSEAVAQMAALGLDMADRIAAWRERGCFMYTVNHPKAFVLVDIAKAACMALGIDLASAEDEAAFFPDPLSLAQVFPVYPEIAKRLGVAGSHLFKPTSSGATPRVYDLGGFIDRSLEMYARTDPSAWRVSPRVAAMADYLRGL